MCVCVCICMSLYVCVCVCVIYIFPVESSTLTAKPFKTRFSLDTFVIRNTKVGNSVPVAKKATDPPKINLKENSKCQ